MSESKSLGLLFFQGPYQSEAPETVCKIAHAALDKGYKVQIFCYMDAANAVLENQKEVPGIYNIGSNMCKLVEKGAIIRVCNLCLLVRGTAKSMMKHTIIKPIKAKVFFWSCFDALNHKVLGFVIFI